ncbi:hypothetical protein R69658_07907 [Paraburkholderia aspalathi]|uniref:Uncharacterized protein n=1 Tax=Paraburkholderia aspalathi TaxID=1324617 RepID=A0ABM8T837_9BURK|nr:hypothetical protein R69658_07907 [Paraburkholderia aspalathi]
MQIHRARDVVGGVLRIELPEEPEPFLCMRQRHAGLRSRTPHERLPLRLAIRMPAGKRRFQLRGERAEPRMIEEDAQGQLHGEGLFDSRRKLDCQQ